jgi:nitrogen-specific signal transduction histidine kinase/CheY-like chemotaxis protein
MASPTKPEQWVLILRDVTQEREIQQSVHQQERLAAVGQLAAGIAHDFNNILAVILLYSEIALRSPDLPEGLQERILTIAQQAKRASLLIQQILDFSRRAVLERSPMDLLPFIKEQGKLLGRTLPESIRVRLVYDPGEYIVNADPTRMQQALMNLALNARDAMPEGGEIRITVSRPDVRKEGIHCVTCGKVIEGNWVRLSVEDTGLGIPADALPHIFEPFFTTKPPGQGTGLGLAQVFGILMQHEGHIEVITQSGQGSTFSLYLPALALEKPEALLLDTETLKKGHGQNILVVEDEEATRRSLVDGMTLLGYNVTWAVDGRQALNILEERAADIDLVLSDVVMPEMGGIPLLHAMREKGLSIPVIFLTGHPLQEELEKLQADSMLSWTMKPPSLKQLALLVARALENT